MFQLRGPCSTVEPLEGPCGQKVQFNLSIVCFVQSRSTEALFVIVPVRGSESLNDNVTCCCVLTHVALTAIGTCYSPPIHTVRSQTGGPQSKVMASSRHCTLGGNHITIFGLLHHHLVN